MIWFNAYKMDGFYRGLVQVQQMKRDHTVAKQETKVEDKTKEPDG